MNTKRIFFASCLAAALMTTSFAIGAPHKTVVRSSPTTVRSSPMTVRNSGTTFHHRHFDHFRNSNQFVFFGGFGFPYGYSYYPYGYYPYGYYGYNYPYDYGYYPYSYGYYRYYNQPGYGYNNTSVVAQVQRHLARAGYYHGAIDGIVGPRTRAAIATYERDHGMRVDGAISNRLLGRMGLRY